MASLPHLGPFLPFPPWLERAQHAERQARYDERAGHDATVTAGTATQPWQSGVQLYPVEDDGAPAPAAQAPAAPSPPAMTRAALTAPTLWGRVREGGGHVFDLATAAFVHGAVVAAAALTVRTAVRREGLRAWAAALPSWCLLGGNVVMASAVGKTVTSYVLGLGGGPLFAATVGAGSMYAMVTTGVVLATDAWAGRVLEGGSPSWQRRVDRRGVVYLLAWDLARDVWDSAWVPRAGMGTWVGALHAPGGRLV